MVTEQKLPDDPESKAAVRAEALALRDSMTVAQGLQAIIANCIAQIQGNEAGVVHGSDPECVHQMRVGLRRLNSVLGLFQEVAPCPPELLEDIAWIRRALGVARDWEVLADEMRARMPKVDQAGLELLQRAIAKKAGNNRRRAAAAVLSPRYSQCVLALQGWATSLAYLESAALLVPLAGFAQSVIKRRHARLLKRGKKLRDADPPLRHRVRIAAKKMRYATEFFQAFYPSRKVQGYVEALSALQEALGSLNDMAVADGLLQPFALRQPTLAPGAWFARGYLAGRGKQESRRLLRLWKRFRQVRLPNQ